MRGRLSGCVDIDHAKDHRFIRSPVAPDPRDIPAGTQPAFGRIADVPAEGNRRLYPDRDLPPILLFDPRTGEQGIQVFPFNREHPEAGDPVEENAMGLLMRNAQWLVQVIGADGFRIDAAKHVDGFVLDLFDRAVYRANPRKRLDGSTKHVFSYCEAKGVDKRTLLTFNKKTIDPNDPGKIGGNRDSLDFELYFRLKDNLRRNGLGNDWRAVRDASEDFDDDGMHNGSCGVHFAASHDDGDIEVSNVANAYVLMHPGNAIVYFNPREFGGSGFPQDGRGDALGGVFGETITRLVDIRNSHGRGNYHERKGDEKELFSFEREGSAIVLLSNRGDAGFDSRTLSTAFAPGTPLVDLTGNASRKDVDPNDDIPELIRVNDDRTINVRFPRNAAPDGSFHGRGYLIYGLAGPQAPAGVELSDVDHVEPAGQPTAETNATTLLAEIPVIKADSFQVKLRTAEVNLLGSIRDDPADGDKALLCIDGGRDINGNGVVDFRSPDAVVYGFERFADESSPRIGPQGLGGPRGDGEFIQTVDAKKLGNGLHYIEVRAFRHRTDGGPAIYSSFKKVIRIDRP